MARDADRAARAAQQPIVGGLPDLPGIAVAMNLSPQLGVHLRGLADALLVGELPGATLTRIERELLATATSAANDCLYCMDSHGAFAHELLARAGVDGRAVVDTLKEGGVAGLDAKMTALVRIARIVQRRSLDLSVDDVARAKDAGATDGDVQLAVLIASAFCMYNRMVDGLRARTPGSERAFTERAAQIADNGYGDPRVVAMPKT